MIIKPFKGILYDKQRIGGFAKVFAPPYDIISPKAQDGYYKASPYNVVRLELNKSADPYRSAAKLFKRWLKDRILRPDERPAIYVYRMQKTIGFIGLGSLNDPALPHEKTFSGPKQDREKLLETVRANLSCVYTLFEDRAGSVNKLLTNAAGKKPFIDVRFDSVRHRLWKVDDAGWIKRLQGLMSDKKIFIADGHHRYEAAVNLRNRMKGQSPYNYVMMYFASMQDGNLTILPTHRVVKKLPRIPEGVFDVEPALDKKSMFDRYFGRKHAFGMYTNRKFSVLKLKNKINEKLDVEILHSLILNGMQDIFYTRDADEAVKLVDSKEYEAAFFLKPTLAAQVRDTSLNGARMPHKSTYFYPKPLTGLVMRSLVPSD